MVSKGDEITTIKVKKSIRDKLKNLKEYPRETNNEVLLRLIKKHLSEDAKHN